MAVVGSGDGIEAAPAIIHSYEFDFTHINFTVNSGYVRTARTGGVLQSRTRRGSGMAYALRSIRLRRRKADRGAWRRALACAGDSGSGASRMRRNLPPPEISHGK
ncbi:hypothetical protein CBM2589_A80037 [Cupriavidus taiwanensis]|uniref:Uncharacterized protein n=1 Tax=Cupriavidus taiwanensis TaxID=164546 RepID=A0A976A7W0_9BURK|nr:hypothetical protein CBM2589_A80037 [Cupriavidus taiwanensis]